MFAEGGIKNSSIVYRQLTELRRFGESVGLDVTVGVEIPEKRVNPFFRTVCGRSFSEYGLVNVDAAERKQTVRPVVRIVVDQQRVTAEVR